METYKVLTLVGGISSDSLNQKLFNGIKNLNLESFEFETYDISKLPHFTKDLEKDPPDSVVAFQDMVRNCDGALFITPEYNRSFPGVLKNAIDWCSRPYGSNIWSGKSGVVIGASTGNIGTFGAQHQLRQVLSYLNMYIVNQPEFYFNATGAFNDSGDFVQDKTKEIINDLFNNFKVLLEKIEGKTLSSKNFDQKNFEPENIHQ